MADKKGNSEGIDMDAAAKQMQILNSNPVMHVKEILDVDGNMISKEVEVMPRSSSYVEFSTDSKGYIKPKVKVYHESPEIALEQAIKIMDSALQAIKKFPMG